MWFKQSKTLENQNPKIGVYGHNYVHAYMKYAYTYLEYMYKCIKHAYTYLPRNKF